jgi:hypothetical protein
MTDRALTVVGRLDVGDIERNSVRGAAAIRGMSAAVDRENQTVLASHERRQSKYDRLFNSPASQVAASNSDSTQLNAYAKLDLAAEKNERRKAAAERAATNERVTADLAVYNQRTALEDRHFELTHTQRQVELRRVGEHYYKLRSLHGDNAKMLTQIDKTYAAEVAAIGGGPGGVRGMHRVGHYAAAEIAGGISPELGHIAGYAMMGEMMGGGAASAGAFAGIAAGAILAGKSIERFSSNLEERRLQGEAFGRSGATYAESLADHPALTPRGAKLAAGQPQLLKELEEARNQVAALRGREFWDQPWLIPGIVKGGENKWTNDLRIATDQLDRMTRLVTAGEKGIHGEENKAAMADSMNAWQKYGEFRERVQERVTNKSLTQAAADSLLRSEMRSLQGQLHPAGDFVDMGDRWKVAQELAIKPQSLEPRMSAAEEREMMQETNRLLKEMLAVGIPIKVA